MKIAKYFDKQLQRECWRLDVTVSGQRFRVGKFATRRAAETLWREIDGIQCKQWKQWKTQTLTGKEKKALTADYDLVIDRLSLAMTLTTEKNINLGEYDNEK